MGEGQTPGDGSSSPFGNHNGATMAGPSSGAHNFIEDPASNAPATGGRDFAAEQYKQPTIDHSAGGGSYDPGSVPQGGELPFPVADPSSEEQAREDNPGVADKAPLPFKNLR